VIRLDGPRGRVALVLALALVGWVAVSRPSAERPFAHSFASDPVAIESFPTLLVTTAERPDRALHTRLGEGQDLWVITVSASATRAPAWVHRSIRSSPLILTAGLVAQGLAGRGPPSTANA
jgi:hypothetical protein